MVEAGRISSCMVAVGRIPQDVPKAIILPMIWSRESLKEIGPSFIGLEFNCKELVGSDPTAKQVQLSRVDLSGTQLPMVS